MPASFLKKLPSDPGYEWNMMGTDLVLVGKTDKLVKEVVKDVFK
jgi:Ni/Co efflux regulator RcnB